MSFSTPLPRHPRLALRAEAEADPPREKKSIPGLGVATLYEEDSNGWHVIVSLTDPENPVLFDLNTCADLDEGIVNFAIHFLQWVLQNEPELRLRLADRLIEGNYTRKSDEVRFVFEDRDKIISTLRPHSVILWHISCTGEIWYDCTTSPEGSLSGATEINVDLDADKQIEFIRVYSWSMTSKRAARFFDRSIPPETNYAKDSLTDQFVSRAAIWGWVAFDPELRAHLVSCRNAVEEELAKLSGRSQAFFRELMAILKMIDADDRNGK
jgi:hypothetical protein